MAALAACTGLLLAGPAAAQDAGDPYGGTSTTAGNPPAADAACSLDAGGAVAGEEVAATVTHLRAGSVVRVQVGGLTAGEATVRAAPAGAASSLTIPIVVPDLPAGSYLVTAAATEATLTCDAAFEVSEVLGAGVTAGGSGRSGSLPRTGIYVALLLAIAVALLLLGRALVEASDERRHRKARAARAARLAAVERAELLVARRLSSK